MTVAPALNEVAGLPLPLIVDLDRTLLKTDTLIEQFVQLLFRSPMDALVALASIASGKAVFKRQVIDGAPVNVQALAFNEEFVAYLHEQKALGRALHLVTAADQRVANSIAKHLPIFDSVVGTNSDHNLKGNHKRDYLLSAFPGGFVYAGDSSADIPIWAVADAAIIVGVSPSTRRAVEGLPCEIEAEFEGRNRSAKQWMRLMRVHQWSKNVLIFAPLILAHLYLDLAAVRAALVTFLAMSLMASGTYIINDVLDIVADRNHKTKRFRPIASGDIDAGVALIAAVALILTGLGISMAVSMPVAGLLVLYLAITLSYSVILKRLVMVDIFVLASLYTLRIVIGVVALPVVISHWLLMFSFFFFFSLSLAKRHVEIVQAARKSDGDVPISGRGYRTGDAPLTLATGVATEMVAVLILSLYIVNDIYPETAYTRPEWLWGVVSMVLIWASRIWLLSHRGELNDDPVTFALRDRSSLMIGAIAATAFVVSVI
ncbi:UbiA family prenyltransferase [Devosia marina]|uniref:UbiA family prenyltransferase n=1 Tax=Devosia marina TaxID=2683198 RepID=UPI0012F984FC